MNRLRLKVHPLILGTLLAATSVHADTRYGRINGHHCAHGGETCPLDRLDPHLALERDFVLQTPEGTYYFMPNLPRDVKIRHVLAQARVTGSLDPRYKTITVDELKVKEDGSFNVVWSQAKQAEEWAYFVGTGGLGPVVGHPQSR
jgi:hypothetical protein